MSKKSNRAALRRLERARAEYMDAMKGFQTEEEIRLALEHEPMVNLRNVQIYSAYYNGARKAFEMMADEGSFIHFNYGRSKGETEVYRKAIFDLITEDIRKTEIFMGGCGHWFLQPQARQEG